MTIMLPGRQVSRLSYIARALVAIALILAFALWMISRSTGTLTRNPTVVAEVPVSAGLITTGAPIRFHGVKVGQIKSINAGSTSSSVGLEIDENTIGAIPSTVIMRVLPRTFFGDIYVQLLDKPDAASTGKSLRDGDSIPVDDGPDAINLYNLFTKLSDVLNEVKPEEMTIALSAVSRAIGDNGDELGVMIDDWWNASRELESTLDRFIESTPKFRAVVESLQRATPSVIDTLRATTAISRTIINNREDLASFFTAASGYLDRVGPYVAEQRNNLITIIDSTATIVSTVAANPDGLSETLVQAEKFGAAGTVLFASGRFNITAVPTFSQPMPYTAKDCPTYGDLRGSDCTGTGSALGVGPVRQQGQTNSDIITTPEERAASSTPNPTVKPASTSRAPVVNGAAEAGELATVEAAVLGQTTAGADPNVATSLMVGPMIRGSQVTIS